jgi:hypothetical protein
MALPTRVPTTLEQILTSIQTKLQSLGGGATVTAIIWNSGPLTATITTSGNHNLQAGMVVNIRGTVFSSGPGLPSQNWLVSSITSGTIFVISQVLVNPGTYVSGGTVTLWTGSNLYISLEDDFVPRSPPGDRFLVIAPGNFTVNQGLVDGGGVDFGLTNASIPTLSTLFEVEHVLNIILWGRIQTDEPERDDNLILDTTWGMTSMFRTSVAYPLQLFDPVDSGGNGILSQPMRLLTFDIPRKTQRAGWAKLTSQWELFFQQNIP